MPGGYQFAPVTPPVLLSLRRQARFRLWYTRRTFQEEKEAVLSLNRVIIFEVGFKFLVEIGSSKTSSGLSNFPVFLKFWIIQISFHKQITTLNKTIKLFKS